MHPESFAFGSVAFQSNTDMTNIEATMKGVNKYLLKNMKQQSKKKFRKIKV